MTLTFHSALALHPATMKIIANSLAARGWKFKVVTLTNNDLTIESLIHGASMVSAFAMAAREYVSTQGYVQGNRSKVILWPELP